MSSKSEDPPPFTLQNTSNDFTKKSDNLFACLQTLEDKHKAFEKARASSSSLHDTTGLQKNDPDEEETQTITSAFKKPRDISKPSSHFSKNTDFDYKDDRSSQQNRERGHRSWQRGSANQRFARGKRTRIPDFRDRPQKWTKYSLEDVEDVSESSNTSAAFSFLDERRKLREAQEKSEEGEDRIDVTEIACSKGLFTFKRPDKSSGKGRQSSDDNAKKLLKSDKSNFDEFTEELKDSSVEDNPEDENKINETFSDKSSVSVFKSNKNKRQRNIRKKDSSSEEED